MNVTWSEIKLVSMCQIIVSLVSSSLLALILVAMFSGFICLCDIFLLKACQESGASCLVYTSTYNVVFGGQEIRNGDESLPYWPLDKVFNS